MNFYITKQEVFILQKGENARKRGGGIYGHLFRVIWKILLVTLYNFVKE